MKLKIGKKVLAREVLIFFGSLLVVIILWCFALLENAYNAHSISYLQDRKSEIDKQVSSLPSDYDENLYEQAKKVFDPSPGGVVTDPIIIAAFNSEDTAIKVEPIEYVSFDEFKSKINEEKYRKRLELSLSRTIDYTEVKKGFAHNHIVANKINELRQTEGKLSDSEYYYESKLRDDSAMWFYVFICSVIVVSIVYVLRFAVVIIIWSIKTIKQKEPQNQESL